MRILFLLVILSVASALQSQVVVKENMIQSKSACRISDRETVAADGYGERRQRDYCGGYD